MSYFKGGLSRKTIELDAARLRVLLGSIPWPPSAIVWALNKILRIPSGTGTPSVYPKTGAGLTSALAAAASGDTVVIPPGTIAVTSSLTVPAGVSVVGMGDDTVLSISSVATGLTLAADTLLADFTISMVGTGSNVVGVLVDYMVGNAVISELNIEVSGGSVTNIGVLIRGAGPGTLSAYGSSDGVTHAEPKRWSTENWETSWHGAGFRVQSPVSYGEGVLGVYAVMESITVEPNDSIGLGSSESPESSGVDPSTAPTLTSNTSNITWPGFTPFKLTGTLSPFYTDGYFAVSNGWATSGTFTARLTKITWYEVSSEIEYTLWEEGLTFTGIAPIVIRCRITATGTGGRAVQLGAYGTGRVYHCILSGATYDLDNGADAVLQALGNRLVNSKLNGGVNYEEGDRSAWDVENWEDLHASDIKEDVLLRHLPGPTGDPADAGKIAKLNSAGTAWELGGSGDTSVLGDRYLVAYNYSVGAALEYRIGLARGPNERSLALDTEPVINLGAGATWEDENVKDPCLLSVDGVLWMYYSGSADGANYAIGLARSFDGGATWTKYASNPVLSAAVGWEGSSLSFPAVLYDLDEADADKRWKMWYGGALGAGGIGYAYSADGLSWTKYASNPVMTPSGGTNWDQDSLLPTYVVRLGDSYHLFYGGAEIGVGAETWSAGHVVFGDPESIYPNAAEPLLTGDGKTSAVAANVAISDTSIEVDDATVFPIGAAVWVYDDTNHYLSHVASRPDATHVVLVDAAPVAILAATGNVRSVAYNSVIVSGALYDKGWRLAVTAFEPLGGAGEIREVSIWGYSDDLDDARLDYGAGLTLPITLAESQSVVVSRENPWFMPLWDADNRFEDDAPAGGQYRQFTYIVTAGDFSFVIDGDGQPVMALQDLE